MIGGALMVDEGEGNVTAKIGEGGMGQPGNGCLSWGTPRSGEAT